jgi:hypothetical protein
MKEAKSRKAKLVPLGYLKKTNSIFPENSLKSITEENSGFMYLSGEQLKSMFLKDKKEKKMVLKNRKTRDISHIKDKIKGHQEIVGPLILPTNIVHLKAMATSPTSTGLLAHHKSLPMVCTHRECIDRLILSPPPEGKDEKASLFSMTLSPDSVLEREYLGNPSGLQDIESLSEWFSLMKKHCKTDEETEIIFDICTKELLRQVSVHSTLRGKLLKEILQKQPTVYSKKLEKAEESFKTFKKEQKKSIKSLENDAKSKQAKLESRINELLIQLAKSEQLKNTAEESLVNYRLGFTNLQRKCLEAETIWRKKAEKYLQELNKIRRVVHVGTDKIAKFFAREEVRALRLDPDILELAEICNKKNSDFECLGNGFGQHQEEIFKLFQKFLQCEEKAFGIEAQREGDGNSQGGFLEEVKERIFFKENESEFRDDKHQDDDIVKQSEKMEGLEIFDDSKSFQFPGSSEKKIHSVELAKSEFSVSIISEEKSISCDQALESSSKPNYEKDEEFIKVNEDDSPSENQGSVEHHYTFNEDEEPSGFELLPIMKTQSVKIKSLDYGINEAASILEESRLSNIDISKEENPLEVIMMSESAQMVSESTQTEEQNHFWLYSKRYEKIEEILNKASTVEAQEAIKAIQEIIQVNKEKIETIDDFHRKELNFRSDTLRVNDSNSSLVESNTLDPNIQKPNGLSKSQTDLESLKVTLLELVSSAGELAAKFEVQKEENARLDEQLELKTSVLQSLRQSNLLKSSKNLNKKDPIPSDPQEKKPGINKKLTLQIETENNTWTEGYESGIEEGKIQGYLWLIEKLKGLNPKYREILSPQISLKSNPELPPKRKTTKLSTKFSEFNFHVPVRQQERKKTHPASRLLDRFLSFPLSKIKTKSTVSRKNVNKALVTIYNQAFNRLSAEGTVSLIDVTYDEFISKYATKAASEKKFLEFVASVVANSDYKRCSMFLKLINYGHLLGAGNFSKYSSHLYVTICFFLFNSKIGIFIGNDDEDKVMIPTIRVVECIKEKFEYFPEKNMVSEIFQKIEKNSQPDPKKINAGGVVEMETVLEIVVEKYENFVQGIVKGVHICLKALGYELIGFVGFQDIQVLLRFFGKTCKEICRDLTVDDFIAICIKFNFCHEDEIIKFFAYDSVDDVSDAFNKDFNFVRENLDRFREDWKNFDFNTWDERLKNFESLAIEEPELAFIGLSFCKSEVERFLSDTRKSN